MFWPVVELEAGSPVGSPQQRLQGTCQVHKHVAHQEEPARHTQAQKLNLDQSSSYVLWHEREYNRVVSLMQSQEKIVLKSVTFTGIYMYFQSR